MVEKKRPLDAAFAAVGWKPASSTVLLKHGVLGTMDPDRPNGRMKKLIVYMTASQLSDIGRVLRRPEGCHVVYRDVRL